MGISVAEILEKDFFSQFTVVAGHKGVHKHIQGVAVLDAPDGFAFTRGREFLISSGYVFKQKPDLLPPHIESGTFQRISCVGIKLGRYLDEFPADLIKACNDYDVPLLSIPKGVPWMEIMNMLNVIVMNKNIQQFNIGKLQFNNLSDLSYHIRKIKRILTAMEIEMDFPTMIYNLVNDKAFYSSDRFKAISQDMKPEDFWNPSFDFSKETLCDNLKMARYRVFNPKYEKPYSWITVPITVENKIKAYFVVLEATGLIDYFDQFALRTGYLLLQELYEQIIVTQSIGDIGFESFVNALVSGNLTRPEEIRSHASELNLNPDAAYYTVVIRQNKSEVSLHQNRELIRSSIRGIFSSSECRTALLDDHHCLLLLGNTEHLEEGSYLNELKAKLKKLNQRLVLDLEGGVFEFGVSDLPGIIHELDRNYHRCLRALDMGKLISPDCVYFRYSQLGALAWIDVQGDEIEIMMRDLNKLRARDDSGQLIETLKAYLECRMNFSNTAKKMFLHINTVRKRVEEIEDLLPVDLEDPSIRLRLELLLKLI